MSRPTVREWRMAFLIAVIAVAITLIPYALGYALQRPAMPFTGIVMNPEDSQSYFAKMLEGYDGQWLYTIPFTSEEHAPAVVGVFYLALGHVARAAGLSLDAIWHIARVLADLVLFLTTFGFVRVFIKEPRACWTAYCLALFGSGLGWVLFLLNQPYWLDAFPIDFKMPEAHLFFSALTFPHVALGTALILAVLWAVQRSTGRESQWRGMAVAGLGNLALAIVYPFLVYLTAAATGIYWLFLCIQAGRVLWRQAMWFSIAFLIPAPLLLGYAWTLFVNPAFRAWDAQAITLSPPWPHYIVGYGVMLVLCGLALRRRSSEHTLLWAWLVAAAVLVYAPLNPQRRFVEGVQVPLAILATVGLVDVVLPWIERTRLFRAIAARPGYSTAGLSRLLIVLFLAGMSLSNLYILASLSVTTAVQQPDLLFRLQAEVAATEWLRANTERSAVLLADYETGNYVAAHAGNRVVVGHWAETIDYAEKVQQVKRFLDPATDDAARRELLGRYHVAYVWMGPREGKLGGYDPTQASYLEPVYSNAGVTIYRVRP